MLSLVQQEGAFRIQGVKSELKERGPAPIDWSAAPLRAERPAGRGIRGPSNS